MIIRCLDSSLPAHQCNAQLHDVLTWLTDNVGSRWHEWEFGKMYGTVIINDEELAVVFKLKFGI